MSDDQRRIDMTSGLQACTMMMAIKNGDCAALASVSHCQDGEHSLCHSVSAGGNFIYMTWVESTGLASHFSPLSTLRWSMVQPFFL
jgi:hypothetical protein